MGVILVAGASSRVIPVVLAVASLAIAQPALAAASGGQAQANASQARAYWGGASVSGASSTPQGEAWENAELVPGTAALNGGGWAGVGALSCTSPGNCAAAGFYSTSQQVEYAFVASQANGSWGKAVPAPGIPGIGGGAITITSMSCVSAGNCAAGGSFSGSYSTDYDTADAFVMNESGGTWGPAEDLSSLGLGNDSGVQVTSIACPAVGDCVAAGSYDDSSGYPQLFVIDETNGTWGDAQEIPGANLNGVSPQAACVSAGNCFVAANDSVAAETDGTWGAAEVLPADLRAMALSCVPGGDCTIGGYESYDAAVDIEAGGTWGTPVLVAHNLNVGEGAEVTSLSCTAGGNCGAVGYYSNDLDETEPFVVNEVDGTWEPGEEVQQSVLNVEEMTGISCSSAGNCGAIGSDQGSYGFVVNEVNGTWGTGQAIPGAVGLDAEPTSISCPAAGFCAVGGQSDNQAFVADEVAATTTTLSLSAAKVPYGDEKAEHLSVTVASKAGGTPTGVAAIAEGSTTICTVTLSAGKGGCTLSATRFGPGTYRVTASYRGAAQFLPSAASAKTLTITRAQTATRIALSAVSVKYGYEGSLHVSVSVSPQYGGTPSGEVTVKAGNTPICVMTLKSEKATCTLTAKRLNVGSYAITAIYGGNADFLASVSARKTLLISR